SSRGRRGNGRREPGSAARPRWRSCPVSEISQCRLGYLVASGEHVRQPAPQVRELAFYTPGRAHALVGGSVAESPRYRDIVDHLGNGSGEDVIERLRGGSHGKAQFAPATVGARLRHGQAVIE